MNNLKLDAKWYTIKPVNPKFFTITKKMHNALQGEKINLTQRERQIYLQTNRYLAEELKRVKSDVLIIHDPQPLPILSFYPDHPPAIWRCHIDTTKPNQAVWRFLSPYLNNYQRFIFHIKDFIPADLSTERAVIFPPAIDPLTDKNKLMSKKKATQIIEQFGIDLSKPLITQVSRFDPWKDPLGVIKAYRLAKQSIPGLQLAYLGLSLAKDDPESLEIYQTVKKAIRSDDRIFLFFDPKQINLPVDLFVNAFQTGSDVILQKSIREGFGLSVTEVI